MIEFLASQTGRWVRILAGLGLIAIGLAISTTAGYLLAAVGVVPLLSGVFDLCLFAPLFHLPLRGREIRSKPL